MAADPSRVVIRLFVPGQEGFDLLDSRTNAVLRRVLALDDADVESALESVFARFEGRHRDLTGTFHRHAREIADRLNPADDISDRRSLLMGAYFTSEYSVEGAALCNPSLVLHPDQAETSSGETRFVMSVRGIGEGHHSSIGFRSGVIDAEGVVAMNDAAHLATLASTAGAELSAVVFRSELIRLGQAREAADYVLDPLGSHFTRSALDERLARLRSSRRTRAHASDTIDVIRSIADRTYRVEFPDDVPLPERVLWPAMQAESAGMEDARFVRFTDDDGSVTYLATYTAYSGSEISQQLLTTNDFRRFTSTPLVGRGAANKGLALFPRRVRGRYVAMSRSDRESNTIAYSDDLSVWNETRPCQQPVEAWEVLQLGNCGSPIESEAGWLVLTHGVGPMRTYSIGAILLDLDDPTKVLGHLRRPLLSPSPAEQDGYVPNVVYSCGALLHGATLFIPYGIGDAAIGIATVALAELVDALTR